jgi:hypothetical protein
MGYRQRAPAVWSRGGHGGFMFLSFQVDSKGKDPYKGSGLIAEVEKALEDKRSTAIAGRARLDQLLLSSELKAVVEHQNHVIASLPSPPASHVAVIPESLRSQYLQAFQPQGIVVPGDLWLRYRTLEDVDEWMPLVGSLLPAVLTRSARVLDPHQLHLGKKLDLGIDSP